jgi:hypothetical protein
MTTRRPASPAPSTVDSPRHSPDWYEERLGPDYPPRPGDRLFIACEGGPCRSRLETFPPRLEVAEPGGMYVLEDVGPTEEWRYLFVSDPD